jgi:hypothetical protein
MANSTAVIPLPTMIPFWFLFVLDALSHARCFHLLYLRSFILSFIFFYHYYLFEDTPV